MEVLGTRTPAFFFEVNLSTNVENYLPSNNFGYSTILDTKIYDVSFWMFAKWAPYDGKLNGLKKPLKKLPYNRVTVGIFHPDKWSSGRPT